MWLTPALWSAVRCPRSTISDAANSTSALNQQQACSDPINEHGGEENKAQGDHVVNTRSVHGRTSTGDQYHGIKSDIDDLHARVHELEIARDEQVHEIKQLKDICIRLLNNASATGSSDQESMITSECIPQQDVQIHLQGSSIEPDSGSSQTFGHDLAASQQQQSVQQIAAACHDIRQVLEQMDHSLNTLTENVNQSAEQLSKLTDRIDGLTKDISKVQEQYHSVSANDTQAEGASALPVLCPHADYEHDALQDDCMANFLSPLPPSPDDNLSHDCELPGLDDDDDDDDAQASTSRPCYQEHNVAKIRPLFDSSSPPSALQADQSFRSMLKRRVSDSSVIVPASLDLAAGPSKRTVDYLNGQAYLLISSDDTPATSVSSVNDPPAKRRRVTKPVVTRVGREPRPTTKRAYSDAVALDGLSQSIDGIAFPSSSQLMPHACVYDRSRR